MGIAAYNRGSRAIRDSFDREARERRVITKRVADRHQCERCFGKIGIRLDRGCFWSKRLSRWFDLCGTCKAAMRSLNSDPADAIWDHASRMDP